MALFRITQESSIPEAASRTDRGVHAEAQVIQFTLLQTMDPIKLQRAMNAHLPLDIRVKSLELLDFHPTLDAKGKEYHYKLSLCPVQPPLEQPFAWHLHLPLDLAKMRKAAQDLLGTRDFSAFANEKEENPICTITSIEIEENLIKIKGDRFLYKMVRNLVGTLVYVGLGKLDNISQILTSKNRTSAGITAPAHGLYLHQVFYQLE